MPKHVVTGVGPDGRSKVMSQEEKILGAAHAAGLKTDDSSVREGEHSASLRIVKLSEMEPKPRIARPRKRALTFVLDGGAELPPAPPPFVVRAVADPDYRADAALEAKGAHLFTRTCYLCHGGEAISGGAAPDLRASQVPLSAQAFNSVVRGGALAVNGMPKITDLSDDDLEALRQYIRSRTAKLRDSQH